MKFLPLIVRNLLRNRRRTILTVLSITISIFMFAALMSLPAVINQILRDRVSNMRVIVTNKAGLLYMLPAAYGSTIRGLPHVEASTGYVATLADYRKPGQQVPILGIERDQALRLFPDYEISPAAFDAFQHSLDSALVSRALAKRFGWKIGDHITLHLAMMTTGDLDFTIVGLTSDARGEIVIVPIERLNQQDFYKDRVIMYYLRLDRAENAPLVIQEVDSRFANSPYETLTQTELGVAQMRISQLRLLFDGVQVIALIIVFVIAMVAGNTAALAVRERRNELAVMRSIGFTRGTLVSCMMTEGLLMGLLAGIFGCAIAYGLLQFLERIGGPLGLLFQFVHLLPSVTAGSIGLAAGIGLVSVAIPALSATRREISDTLRAVG
ncbi:MAG TPA: ABC transporter permease [Candidatus Binataceae bacterium]|nr:ABC transporter permease [Candidatus Binataceae bacterium]